MLQIHDQIKFCQKGLFINNVCTEMLLHVFLSLFNQMMTRKKLNHLKLPNHLKQVRNQEEGFLLGFCETAPIATITCLARAMMDSIELHWNVLAFCFESILSYFPVIPCCKQFVLKASLYKKKMLDSGWSSHGLGHRVVFMVLQSLSPPRYINGPSVPQH